MAKTCCTHINIVGVDVIGTFYASVHTEAHPSVINWRSGHKNGECTAAMVLFARGCSIMSVQLQSNG